MSAVDWENIRKTEFLALEKQTYLMAASASPMSRSAYESGINYFNELLKYGDLHFESLYEDLERTRKYIAESLNAKEEEIAFLINTSSCMNIAARLINMGETLYPSREFPASIHIFKRLGFPCVKIESNESNIYHIDKFREKLTNKTKHLIHSHVQSFTGFRQNLDLLGDFCEASNLTFIVNATQSFGAFELDVKRSRIDILAANALKWACCGYGIGILYVNEEIIKRYEVPVSGWLSVEDPFLMDNDNIKVLKVARAMDALGGCPNFASLLTLKGGFELIKRIGDGNIRNGIKNIQERIIKLTSYFIEQIQAFNFKIITPLDLNCRSGIVIIEHEQAKEIYNHLLEYKIYISLRRYAKSTQETLLRFSFNYYNNLEDINKTIKVLKQFIN